MLKKQTGCGILKGRLLCESKRVRRKASCLLSLESLARIMHTSAVATEGASLKEEYSCSCVLSYSAGTVSGCILKLHSYFCSGKTVQLIATIRYKDSSPKGFFFIDYLRTEPICLYCL